MKKIYILILLLLLGCAYYFFFFRKDKDIIPTDSQANVVSSIPLDKTYSNNEYGFSFNFADDINIEESNIEGNNIIIVTRDSTKSIFQIYIGDSSGEQVNITAETLKRDVPDLSVSDPQEVIIGDSGKGLAFISEEDGEKKREVWFTYGNSFYQITAPMNSDDFLRSILNTWKFGK